MASTVLAWVVLSIAPLAIVRDAWRNWRRASANPARATLPRLISLMLIAIFAFPVMLPFSFLQVGERRILLANPGFGTVHLGDNVLVADEASDFISHIVVGLPADRLRVEGASVEANGEVSTALPWRLRREATGCMARVVPEGHLAVISPDHPDGCEAFKIVSTDELAGRYLFVLWPPWQIGHVRLGQTECPATPTAD